MYLTVNLVSLREDKAQCPGGDAVAWGVRGQGVTGWGLGAGASCLSVF